MNAGDIVILGGDARLIVSSKAMGTDTMEVVLSNGDQWSLNTKSGLGRQMNDNAAKHWPLVTWFSI